MSTPSTSSVHRTLAQRLDQPGFWGLLAAIILSVATLATAWCSFQAASWNGEAGDANRSATVARFEAIRQGDIADRQLQSDLLIFATWLEAETLGNDVFAQTVEQRFRSDFRPAFAAWLSQGSDGQLADGSPFDLPEYSLPGWREEERLNRVAVDVAAEADAANATSNAYVLSAVLYASVMFLAGIAAKLPTQRGRRVVIDMATLVLVGTLITTLIMPMDIGL